MARSFGAASSRGLAALLFAALVAACAFIVPICAYAGEDGDSAVPDASAQGAADEGAPAVAVEATGAEDDPVVLDLPAQGATDAEIQAVLAQLPAVDRDAAYAALESDSEPAEAPEGQMTAQALANDSDSVTSYYGETMYETAVEQAKATYPNGAESAIIAGPGDAWVDALAAAGLASAKGPILFANQDSMHKATLQALKDLGVKSVIIVGGPAALGYGVEADLQKAGVAVEARLWGQNCFGTQMAIYDYGVKQGIWSGDMAIMATYTWFGDALSASPIAYAKRAPIFLVDGAGELNAEQKSVLSAAAKKGTYKTLVITGGTAVVSTGCEDYLKGLAQTAGGSCVRLGGAEQYETSALISQWAVANCGFTWDRLAFTTGKLPYDALAGSVFQGTTKAPLLLVDNLSNATVSTAVKYKAKVSHVRFFGGPVAIPWDLRADIATKVSNVITYVPTGIAYDDMLSLEYNAIKNIDKSLPKASRLGYSEDDIDECLDPAAYKMGDPEFYQFALLNMGYSGKVTAQQLDAYINEYGYGGMLMGTGQDFIDAAQKYDVNEVYLLSNAILESGWGRSTLAMGIEVKGKKYYNFFGIGAYDSDPEGGGSTTAGQYGWSSPRAAIMGGASWISDNYLDNMYPQNTLYKMRWNYMQAAEDGLVWKQYATGRQWAIGIARVMNSCYFYNGIAANSAGLRFEVPQYE